MNASFPVVCFGEVLWDILHTAELPGGAPMNVAYHLKKLNIEPALITRVGLDVYGDRLRKLLSEQGVTTDYFQTDLSHPTGKVFADANDKNEVVYDIVFPSAWDFIDCDESVEDLVAQSDYFLFGSLACRNEVSKNTLYTLLESAKIKVFDINLRPPHYDRSVIEYLLKQSEIVKMNENELQIVSSWYNEYDVFEDCIRDLQERFMLDTVIVTMGGEGAMIKDNQKFHRHRGHKVQVADTIGSGDAFLAGFLSQIIQQQKTETALAFASAMGAFVATQTGACPSYSQNDILPFLQNKTVNDSSVLQ